MASIGGKMVDVIPLRDPKELWSDLYTITQSQVQDLKDKVTGGQELDKTDFQKLDSCYRGLERLLVIEKDLKSDVLTKLTNDELSKLVKKTQREERETPEERKIRLERLREEKLAAERAGKVEYQREILREKKKLGAAHRREIRESKAVARAAVAVQSVEAGNENGAGND